MGMVAALFINPLKTVDADEEDDRTAANSIGGIPAFLQAAPGLRLERHHLRRPLRWRK
jgi:hypothetical protein